MNAGGARSGRARDERTETAPVLLLGATGQVGHFLIARLLEAGAPVIAVSRRVPDYSRAGLTWLQQDLDREPAPVQAHVLISAGPLELALKQAGRMPGLDRVVALSSASVLFKQASPDRDEREMIRRLAETETELEALCRKRGIDLTLLRPTLIYGGPGPSAAATVAGWLKHRSFAPVAGRGLRQPVHADDIAALMVRLVARAGRGIETFEIGGGETLAYPEFIRRIASSIGRDPRLVPLPAWLIGTALRLLRPLGIARRITPAMVARQRMDLVVDDTPAREQLDWTPRPFRP